jgi:ppGpp synthetase/RelA/SpoT-type nucleotidyltranferase
VSDTAEQDRVVVSLIELFRDNNIVDRRQTPSHGYRAVHVITRVNNKWVEIQIRTALQQLWAELSEKLSDLIDPAIKYGGGDDRVKRVLATASELVALQEDNELKLLALQQARPSFKSNTDMTQDTSEGTIDQQSELDHLREAIMNSRNRTIEIFQDFIKN